MKAKAYAIDFRDMSTAIHGLFVFRTKALAEKGEKIVKECNGNMPYVTMEKLFEHMPYYFTEIDFRNIDENNNYYECGVTYKVINSVAYDLYFVD